MQVFNPFIDMAVRYISKSSANIVMGQEKDVDHDDDNGDNNSGGDSNRTDGPPCICVGNDEEDDSALTLRV